MATPVSNTSVVTLRMPSTAASTSEVALVMSAPALSCARSARGVWTMLLYSVVRMERAAVLAKRRT